MTGRDAEREQLAAAPIKGRCGTCDWPTDHLPCAYCVAVSRDRAAALRASNGEDDDAWDPEIDPRSPRGAYL